MQNLPDENLLRAYPWIPWGDPWIIRQGDNSRYGCRMCVAQYGLTGEDFDRLYSTLPEWHQHVTIFHPEVKLNVET